MTTDGWSLQLNTTTIKSQLASQWWTLIWFEGVQTCTAHTWDIGLAIYEYTLNQVKSYNGQNNPLNKISDNRSPNRAGFANVGIWTWKVSSSAPLFWSVKISPEHLNFFHSPVPPFWASLVTEWFRILVENVLQLSIHYKIIGYTKKC